MSHTVVRRLLSCAITLAVLFVGAGLVPQSATAAAAGAILRGQVLGEDGRPTSTHTGVTVQRLVGGRWQSIGYDSTDFGGGYRIEGVPAGSYRVEFEQLDHLVQHQQVTLVEGEDRVLDVVLDRGAAITGRVLAPAGGPGANAFVRLYARMPMATGSGAWQQVDYAFVEPSGAYAVSGFRGGTYRIGVSTVGDVYPAEFHHNVTTVEDALDLSVADDGTITGIDFDLGTAPVDPVLPPAAAVAFTRQPELRGKARVGKVLRVRAPRTLPSTATVSYRWSVGPRQVRRSTRSLRVTRAMVGERVRVRVVARAAGHRKASVLLRTASRVRR